MSKPVQSKKTSLLIILLSFAVGIWLPLMPHVLEAEVDRFGPGAIDRFNEFEVGFRVLTYFCYFVGFQSILLAVGMLWHRSRKSNVNRPAESSDGPSIAN